MRSLESTISEIRACSIILAADSGVRLPDGPRPPQERKLTETQARRLVSFGAVKFLTKSFKLLAEASPSANATENSENPTLMKAWGDTLSLLFQLLDHMGGANIAPWILGALREFRGATYDIIHSMAQYPPAQSLADCEDAVYLCRTVGNFVRLPNTLCFYPEIIDKMSLRAIEEVIKYSASVWYPRRIVSDDLELGIFLTRSLHVMMAYLEAYAERTQGQKNVQDADLSRLASLGRREIIERALENSRIPAHPPHLRISHLHLLYLFQMFAESSGEPGHSGNRLYQETNMLIMDDCCDAEVVTTMSAVLSDIESTAWLEVRDLRSGHPLSDSVFALWCRIMQHAYTEGIPKVAVECAKSDMIAHLAVWTMHRPAESDPEVSIINWIAGIGDFFQELFQSTASGGQKDRVDASLIVRASINLIRARKLVESAPRAPNVDPLLVNKWKACERHVLQLFDALGEAAAHVPRCAGPSCQRAWDPEGFALRACSRCRTVEYCSPACQKFDWKAHKKTCGTQN